MARKCLKKSMISAIEKKDEPKKEAKPIEEKTSRVRKSNKKIKTVNSEDAPTVGVVCNVELQISEWKGKEDFEVIKLDDYDYVLGLNFLNRIQTVLFPWADQIYIVTGPLSKIVVLMHRDMKVGTKVLPSIQLVEDVLYGRNINSIEPNATKAPSKNLVEHETNMRPVKSTVEPSPLGNVGCVSIFEGKEMMQK
ncbi:hypothetical protein J1N35_040300 [Gossypium stocksii]|uniref:Uncharacterized protein n=1 Tax=Gossypium stocksii TaxID=47602 RepID=A0A9D3UDQ4_9ROSI|nr:hypothetical protein J1N35_040300 [Gossypium stocksii]